MSKAIIVPDLEYTSHQGRRGGRSNGRKELRAKLRYFQYRNDRNGHIPQEEGRERWVDRGLGQNYGEIAQRCEALSSKGVLAWTWVVSPAPDLIALVPEDKRAELVVSLTEQIVERYYEAREEEPPEYSYVLHDRLTKPGEGYPAGMQQLHTHVVLSGTVPDLDGGRKPFYNRSAKGHIDLLHQVSTDALTSELDRYIGPDWRKLRPDIAQVIPQEPVEVNPQVIEPELSELDQWFPRNSHLSL